MTYVALTIGPILKTLQHAKKPKELFSSSYIFSYVMRQIIDKFRNNEFVMPYIKDASIFDSNSNVGLFHDRFIFKSKEGDLEKLENAINEVLQEVSDNLNIDLTTTKNYFQIHFFEKKLKDNENPILVLTPYLDSKELFLQSANDDTFLKKLSRKKGDKDNFLTENKGIVDDLKQLSSSNYYCVVHADGDNMGKAISDINNIEQISKSLFDYCVESSQLIKNFGGQTIFAGGDDLLFFAPIYDDSKSKSIFNLCDEISLKYDRKFNNVTTLSFGISVHYIKFPLYEAVEHSRKLLFSKAKDGLKNSIAVGVSKHSGQSFETTISKFHVNVYQQFLKFTSNIHDNDSTIGTFLHSIHHKIDTHKSIIEQIGNDRGKLQNFFNNNFNESIHKEYTTFFEYLIDFIYEVYQEEKIDTNKKLDIVYFALRFIKFIKGDK
jgi:CRISPR-associated protein Cmr2